MKTWLTSPSPKPSRLLAAVAGAIILLGSALPGAAAQITFDFIASIRNVVGTIPGVAKGGVIAGSYTFESTTPDSSSAVSIGDYRLVMSSVTVLAGGQYYSLAAASYLGNRIVVENDKVTVTGEITDRYILNADLSGGFELDIDADDRVGTAFTSDALPLNPPNIPAFQNNNFFFRHGTNFARGGLISLTKVATDTTPPVLSLPGNLVVEAIGPSGATVSYSASATDDVDGSVPVTLSPASGSTFPLGTTTVNASATDAAGNTSTGSFTVTVRDTTAPVITSLAASPAVLWPPNHKMVSVSVSGSATEAVSAVTGRILSVTSNEPDDGLGDGDTANDIVVTGPGTVSLRAERSGQGNGRIYTILFEARDASGNASTRTVTVSVPKSQGK